MAQTWSQDLLYGLDNKSPGLLRIKLISQKQTFVICRAGCETQLESPSCYPSSAAAYKAVMCGAGASYFAKMVTAGKIEVPVTCFWSHVVTALSC